MTKPYNPDRQTAVYRNFEIKTFGQLYTLTRPIGENQPPAKWMRSAKYCRGECEKNPKFTKWISKTHRYCRTCERGIPNSDIILKNRCPCCKQPVRFTSTWTQAKKLRSLQVTK